MISEAFDSSSRTSLALLTCFFGESVAASASFLVPIPGSLTAGFWILDADASASSASLTRPSSFGSPGGLPSVCRSFLGPLLSCPPDVERWSVAGFGSARPASSEGFSTPLVELDWHTIILLVLPPAVPRSSLGEWWILRLAVGLTVAGIAVLLLPAAPSPALLLAESVLAKIDAPIATGGIVIANACFGVAESPVSQAGTDEVQALRVSGQPDQWLEAVEQAHLRIFRDR